MKHFRSPKKLSPFRLAVLFVVVFGLALFFLSSRVTQAPQSPVLPTPQPTPYPVQVADVHSEDGTMTIATKISRFGKATTYTFLTGHTSNTARSEVFSKIFKTGGSLVAPANAWSPDNTYFYLIDRENGVLTGYVFKASDQAFGDGLHYLDIGGLWAQRQFPYSIEDITGWDSSTLLHVLTVNAAGEDGPSFWFDIPSRSFIQLATR